MSDTTGEETTLHGNGKSRELESLRKQIPGIDDQIFALLERRNQTTDRIGEIKRELGMPTHVPEVEQANTARLSKAYDEETVEAIYPQILEVSKARQRKESY